MIASVSIISKPSLNMRNAGCGLHLLDMGHVGGAQHDAEHQPRRNFILGAIAGPAEPGAAQQSAVEPDRVGPVETDLPLRRAMRRYRVGQRIHAGKERPARRGQRFVGFEHHGEFDQVVAPHPDQRSRACFGRDLAAMRERVAKLAQRDQSIARGQIECLFHVREARHHRKAHP